ncbi:hypothetical protein P170DRAFT_416668 [Aspergillus steynii IBT 23096]|uniref:PRISE-like Rossmann-fold domain-containing protein n=1 Tax=Aspergillus steynii IBT 23096 TaxID=1392250 RepID=A0A2I2FU80_9EURO|nr:uncharacterized protein P170DRAFT_416668 [Aspergillus steynii IBT 23096]PLB44203.1 hypothetical protein P170DRAFT_416668 [Aspergillus steynii IBT 23096]
MTNSQNNVALVFGASGISGWAATKNLLTYPTPTTFSRVVGLTNRPKTVEESGLPQDPRLELYSGIDLRSSFENVVAQMQKIPNLDQITHIYYLAYSNATAYSQNVMDIRDINVHMTYNAVHASDQLCKSLKFLVLQTGTNNYGVAVFRYQDKIEINPPLKEDNPRIPSPWGDEIFYYRQVDLIKEASKGKQWKWCEVRPDQIVGHVPSPTSMTYVEPLALYLALYRYVNGPGSRVQFPGSHKSYTYTFTDSSQDIISKSEIYLSVVKPEQAHGEGFNIADTETPGPWSVKWPLLADHFGLEAAGPSDEGWVEIDKWWQEHAEDYKRMCAEYGLQYRVIGEAAWIFCKVGFTMLHRNRELSLQKIRGLGFTEEIPVGQSYIDTFEHMARERILPPSEALRGGQ